MIEFLTLLLGLTLGPRAIEVAVTEPVVAVELHLDGRLVERREGPPWSFEVDLGHELRPHRLEAVGFDAEGQEVARKRQWINYARRSFEAAMALEQKGGLLRGGRVLWAAANQRNPIAIVTRLNGQILPMEGNRFTLPDYDPSVPHHLSAEVTFSGDHLATTEAIFGGVYGEKVTSALTAAPLMLEAGQELPDDETLSSWFSVDGASPKVTASAVEGTSLMFVRDTHIDPNLRALTRQKRAKYYADRGKLIDGDDEVLFMLTFELTTDPKNTFRTVPITPDYFPGGLWYLLTQNYPKTNTPSKQSLWFSLALAGKRMSDVKKPRAVILALSKRPKDHSAISFQQAADYLRRLNIPLYVWTLEPETFERLGIEPGPRFFTGSDGMVELYAALESDLARQRIVWLEGEHLPTDIQLTDAAPEGVAFAQ